MVLFALAFLLVLVFIYNTKIFIYSLVVFFVLFDMFDGFYKDEKVYAAIRYLIPFLFLSFFIIRESALKRSEIFIAALSLYLIVLLVYLPGDVIIASKNLFAIILTLLMIPVGRCLGRRVDFIREFEPFNRFLLIALPAYIAVANIMDFGESYSEAFTTGFLVTSRMYIVPIVVFLAIHYVISNKERNWLLKSIDVGFILINMCIIIINTRRTCLGMLGMALVTYALLNRRMIFKMAVLGLFFIGALVLTYPLYEPVLMAQLEKRERIQDIDTYEEEGRFLETVYIFDHHSRNQRIGEVMFGVKLFDTFDFGTRYFGRDRPIHSDFNMIFYSTGVLGLFLFTLVFLNYFFFHNQQMEQQSKKIFYPMLVMFLIVLIPGRFIGTLTYAPFLMLVLSAVKAWRPYGVITPDEGKRGSN